MTVTDGDYGIKLTFVSYNSMTPFDGWLVDTPANARLYRCARDLMIFIRSPECIGWRRSGANPPKRSLQPTTRKRCHKLVSAGGGSTWDCDF